MFFPSRLRTICNLIYTIIIIQYNTTKILIVFLIGNSQLSWYQSLSSLQMSKDKEKDKTSAIFDAEEKVPSKKVW